MICVIGISLLLAQAVAALFGFRSVRGSLLNISGAEVGLLLIWLAGVVALKFFLDYARLRLRGDMSEDFARWLRNLTFEQHLRADLRRHEARDAGRSLLRFSGDLSSAQRLLMRGVFQYGADLALLCMGLGFVLWFDGRLAWLVAGTTAAGWLLIYQINNRLRDVEERRRSKKARLLAFVSTTLRHLPSIQALNRGTRAAQHFSSKSEKIRAFGRQYHRLAAASEALPLFFVQILLLIVLAFGWKLGLPGDSLFAIVLVLMSWRSPLARLLRAGLIWKKGLLSLEKIDALLRSPVAPEGNVVLRKKRARTLRLHAATLRFGEKTAFENLSFQLSAGETRCLNLGAGGGKTALAKLLAGLYRPDLGRVEWDGQSAENFTAHSLRRQVAARCAEQQQPNRGVGERRGGIPALADAFPALQSLDFQQKINEQTPALSAGQQRLLQSRFKGKVFLKMFR